MGVAIDSMSLNNIIESLGNGDFSSEQLVESSLKAIQGNPGAKAFLSLNEAGARAAARRADDLRRQGVFLPLLGVPFAVKDNIAVLGQPLTCGSPLLSGLRSPYDASVIVALKSAGAIPLGKTTLDAFAMGSTTEHHPLGAVPNPVNPGFSPGGSSGGSAVAVKLGFVPFALGSDTGGSVRQPAAHCGLVGFKPSYGAYSRYGLVAFASSLDGVGILSQGVSGCRLLHPLLVGHDPKDATSCSFPRSSWEPEYSLKNITFAVPVSWLKALDFDRTVAVAFQRTLVKLSEAGARLVDVDLPLPQDNLAAYSALSSAEAASNMARFDALRYGKRAESASPEAITPWRVLADSRGEGLGMEVKRRVLMGVHVLQDKAGDRHHQRATKSRRRLRRAFDGIFQRSAALLCPTVPTLAPKLGQGKEAPLSVSLGDALTVPMNLAGIPALSLPMGESQAGLPIGLQIVGPYGGDEDLLALSALVERTLHGEGPELETPLGMEALLGI